MTRSLSPAEKVMEAYLLAQLTGMTTKQSIAAVLEALADQVTTANGSPRNNEIRSEILAIATELEGKRG